MVRLSVEIKDLFEDESRQHISGKQFVCHLLYLLSRNGINALVELFEITFLSVVEIASAEVKGKLLTVVTGNGELTFQLALGRIELGRRVFAEYPSRRTRTDRGLWRSGDLP